MTLLTDELRSWIGRAQRYTAPEELGRASLRYFALAVGDDNPLYTDAEVARAHGHPDVVAPPTFVCETNQYAHRRPDGEGYIGHRWELPVTGCRLVRGGHDYTFSRPVYPSDRITVTWRVVDIRERESSRGGTLLMVESEAVYTNQDDELLARNVETLIYQPLDAG